MSHSEKKAEFLSRISDCAGLIHKIVAIYTDRIDDFRLYIAYCIMHTQGMVLMAFGKDSRNRPDGTDQLSYTVNYCNYNFL